MTTELTVLAWGCVLAFVHILAAAQVKTRQYGTKWNMGARDEELPPPRPIVGRLDRAQANFFETFPIMIAAVLIVSAAGLDDQTTALGAWLWLGARRRSICRSTRSASRWSARLAWAVAWRHRPGAVAGAGGDARIRAKRVIPAEAGPHRDP